MKDSQHYHSVAAAWLEAQCTTRGVRLQRELAHAICANLAKAAMDSAAAVERADKELDALNSDRARYADLFIQLGVDLRKVERLEALIREERSWAWWRRVWRWVRFKECA